MIEQFHLLRPLWLLAMPLFWLVVWWFRRARGGAGVWRDVCDPDLAPYVLRRDGGARPLPAWTILAAGTVLLLALSGPTWEQAPVPVFRGQSALVVVLDLSASMNAADVEPSRLARARFKIADLLDTDASAQTALVVFATHAFVVTPLTGDRATIKSHLQGLETGIMPAQGSEPAAGLELARQLLGQAGAINGQVLLITDGADRAALARARDALAGGDFTLSVLGVGSSAGAPIPDSQGGFVRDDGGNIIMSSLDGTALGELARAGGGTYAELGADNRDIRELAARIDSGFDAQARKLEDLAASQWREAGPWLLLPLLPLAAIGFRRGLIVGIATLALLPVSDDARAGWWWTDDQAGSRAFARGAWDDAAAHFQRRDWRGAANYRAGAYEQALGDFADGEDARSHYNRGNALARLGRYEEAIAAYDKSLELAPDLADAAHNRQLIEQLLSEQKPPPTDQQNRSDDDAQDDGEQDAADQQGQIQGAGGETGGDSDQSLSDSNSMGGDGGEDGEQANQTGSADSESAGEQAQQDQGEQDNNDEAGEAGAAARAARDGDETDAERAQATEQWLRQIPDDPGGLLRRKFHYLYKKQYGSSAGNGDAW